MMDEQRTEPDDAVNQDKCVPFHNIMSDKDLCVRTRMPSRNPYRRVRKVIMMRRMSATISGARDRTRTTRLESVIICFQTRINTAYSYIKLILVCCARSL